MDKKSLIGLVLMGVLLVGYSLFTKPSKEDLERNQRINDSIAIVEAQRRYDADQMRKLNDSLPQVSPAATAEEINLQKINELGAFAEASEGEEKFFFLENKKIRVKFSTKGGRPYSAELKDYKTFEGKPVLLFDGESTQFSLKFFSQNKSITTQNLFFESQSSIESLDAESGGAKSLVMRLHAGEGDYIDYVYSLEPDSYKLGFTIRMHGMDKVFGNNTSMIDLDWSIDVRQQEKGKKWETQYATIQYKFFQDEVGKLSPSTIKKPTSENLTTKVEWIGFKQQFFSTVLSRPP